MSDAVDKVEDHAATIEEHPVAAWWAAVGQVANGLVHVVIGMIAISVARGAGGQADQAGAMRAIDSTPLGSIGLWACGLALLGLGIHQIAVAVGQARREKGEAVKSVGRAIAYFAVGSVGLVYATGGTADGEETAHSLSGDLMQTWWGSALLVLVGVVAFAIGVAMIVRGVRRSFLVDVQLSARSRPWFTALGVAGYVAKGIAVAAVGVLFVVAVAKRDPSAAGGLDGALKSFVGLPFGPVVLVGIAVGLILYGVFCLARARTVAPAR